jgi:hypothetical protein
MATNASETAVRNYLTFLNDPDSLVDQAAVKKLQSDVEQAKDPIDKVRAISQLENARRGDPDVYRQGFVENAKPWAEAEGVAPSAFEQMGVPQDVLREAGFLGGLTRKAKKLAKGVTKGAASAQRRPSMKAGELERGILALGEPFSVKDVSEKVGGSMLTVRAAIDRLEAQGRIMPAGERTGGRGRSSKVWTVAVEPM